MELVFSYFKLMSKRVSFYLSISVTESIFMNIFSYFTKGSPRASRVVFVWIMLLSLVLQTSMISPSIASADVVVNVSHTDGSVTQHVLASSTDNAVVDYSMGATAASGTPTLSALVDILGSLNTALVTASADAAAKCTGDASATASASVTGVVTIDQETAVATASANTSVKCTGSSSTGSSATASSSSTVTITTTGSGSSENQRPVISVIGTDLTVYEGSTYVDQGATVWDAEDGNITNKLVVSGTVNTSVLGVYTISYNATDSKNLPAYTKTRTVTVVAAPVTACTQPIDVMIVIDRSGSMKDDTVNGGAQQPLTQAKEAVSGFIDTLKTTTDRVGIVSFNENAVLNMSLTNDFAAAKASMTFSAAGLTDIAAGLDTASNEMSLHSRSNAKHTMILLTDGDPTDPNTTTGIANAKTSAAAAKALGYTIYTIGLGTAVSPTLLKELASSQSNYYFAPTATDLASIYRTISTVECEREPSSVSGHKWSDLNGNGALDTGETGLSGWTITMSQVADGIVGIQTAITDASGAYTFNNLTPAVYRVCEVNQNGWNQTAPSTGCYEVDVKEGMNYAHKDFFNQAVQTPIVCSVDIVSDTTNLIDGAANAVATYASNPAWTASIPGATWIWSSFNVTDPSVDQTTLFTKSFTLSDPIASASLTIAADNNFTAAVNGTQVAADASGLNYGSPKIYDVTAQLHTGMNAASFSVKNIGLVGSSPTSNPAGLLYKLHVVYNKTGCVTPVNHAPEITVLGDNPMVVRINTIFTDPGATALDQEDGNITAKIATTSTVSTTTVGNYKITYNVSDSQGLAAVEKVRVVKVVSACSDGVDNDADGKVDMADTGCDNPNDDNENTPPSITLLGANPMSVTLGTTFVDPGANATDTEDCLGVAQAACNTKLQLTATGVVNTAALGSYTITYTAVDSKGVSATPVTRTVTVVSGPVSNNQPPVITLIGDNPMVVHIKSSFVDPSATVADPEDGNITWKLVATGTVDMMNVGNYTITYNATDTKNLAAQEKTRTVKVVSSCSDGVDNDNDGTIDMSDTGCENPNDDSENTKPVITLIGETVMQLLVGSSFTDPSATVFDAEDGDITNKLVATGTVNTAVLGTYTITYNATDTQNLAADQKTRTVTVYNNVIPGCTGNCGGETNVRPIITMLGDNPLRVYQNTTFTDPGATAYDQEDGDITAKIVKGGMVDTSRLGTYTITYDVSDSKGLPAQQKYRTVNVVENTTPGCTANCGGGSVSLSISNEKITVTGTTTVTITWTTNLAADSRVVYGLLPVSPVGVAPYYGYPLTTATDTAMVTSHSMVITGIPSALATYFRPVSSNGNQTVTGIELKRTPEIVSGGSCEYLKEYLRIGVQNNPAEVLKLQLFLKNFEGFSTIPTDSFFGVETDKAVRTFQDKYKDDVLTPWNLPGNTGYVYYTTKKKINEIYCQREFPLNATQLEEIAAFRELIKRLGAPTGVNAQTVLPLVGAVAQPTNIAKAPAAQQGAVAGAATVKDSAGASASTSGSKVTTRGRVALADLLAISPSMSGELSTGTKTDEQVSSSTSGLAEGETLVKRNFLQAAVGSISNVTHLSEVVVLIALFLVILLLIAALFYARRCAMKRATVTEMEV